VTAVIIWSAFGIGKEWVEMDRPFPAELIAQRAERRKYEKSKKR